MQRRAQPNEEKEPKVNRFPQLHGNRFIELEGGFLTHLLENYKVKPDPQKKGVRIVSTPLD